MESFGGQSVELVTVSTSGQPGFLGVAEEVRTSVVVSGCRGRQLSADEVVGQTDTATEVWKWTMPPTADVLAVKPPGELLYEGRTFQIDGPIAPKRDMEGRVHHVTILAKIQAG